MSGFDFGAVRAVSGNCGLNGGSNAGTGKTNVSFDDWAVCESANEAIPKLFAIAVESAEKLSATWGGIKSGY